MKKFALDLDKLKTMPLDQSMAVVETSVARGNLKYHAAAYVLQLRLQLTIHNGNRKRQVNKDLPQTVVIGVCRLAISSSTLNRNDEHFVHTPAIGRSGILFLSRVSIHR